MSKDLVIYMATHNKRCSHIECYDYIVPIQVGKALSNKDIAEVSDDTGDNISDKNEAYCELTALYWMWKNSKAENIGLYHYRRRFDIDKERILSILNNNDIIIPRKKVFRISLKDQYIKEHSIKDWNILINVLKTHNPEYYESSKKVFTDNKIYRFNMFISKKELFDKYCRWVFPILDKVYEKIGLTYKDNYQKRYIGFMAERLFTLYIFHNKFNVYEADVLFEEKKIKLDNVINFINNIIFNIKT